MLNTSVIYYLYHQNQNSKVTHSFSHVQDETVTIETVFPFDVAVKFVSTKVCDGNVRESIDLINVRSNKMTNPLFLFLAV